MKRIYTPIDDSIPVLIFVLYFAIIFLSYFITGGPAAVEKSKAETADVSPAVQVREE